MCNVPDHSNRTRSRTSPPPPTSLLPSPSLGQPGCSFWRALFRGLPELLGIQQRPIFAPFSGLGWCLCAGNVPPLSGCLAEVFLKGWPANGSSEGHGSPSRRANAVWGQCPPPASDGVGGQGCWPAARGAAPCWCGVLARPFVEVHDRNDISILYHTRSIPKRSTKQSTFLVASQIRERVLQ